MLNIFWECEADEKFSKKISRTFELIERTILKNNKEEVNIIFASAQNIKELNRKFRGKNKETDVLSFPNSKDKTPAEMLENDLLGEIYINVDWILDEKIRKEVINSFSKGNGIIQSEEKLYICQILFIHGLLHLLGYDHEKDQGEMEEKENYFRNKLL